MPIIGRLAPKEKTNMVSVLVRVKLLSSSVLVVSAVYCRNVEIYREEDNKTISLIFRTIHTSMHFVCDMQTTRRETFEVNSGEEKSTPVAVAGAVGVAQSTVITSAWSKKSASSFLRHDYLSALR